MDPLTGFVAWLGTQGVAQTLVRFALTVAFNAVVAKLTVPKPKTQELQSEFQQTDAPMRGFYGRNLVSGIRAFWAHVDGVQYRLLILATGGVSSIEEYWLDGKQVFLSGAEVVSPDYVQGSNRLVTFATRLGATPSPAYSELVAAFPGEWTSAHRLDGHTTVLAMFERVRGNAVRDYYPSGDAPPVALVLHGRAVLDPRTSVTAYSANVPLCLMGYLTHPDGGGESVDEFHLPDVIAAADIADQAVPLLAGGTEPRYRCAVAYDYNEPVKDVAARFLTAMGGRIYERPDGKIGMRAGAWIAPVYTIRPEHIIAIDYGDENEGVSRYSRLPATFVDPAGEYTSQAMDPWVDAALVAELGGTVNASAAGDYAVAPSHRQARRLAEQQTAYDNPKWMFSVTLRFWGLLLMDQQTVRLSLPDLEIEDEDFWIDGWSSDQTFTMFTVRIRSAQPEIFADDSVAKEGTGPTYPDPIADDAGGPPAPLNLVVAVATEVTEGGAYPVLIATWDVPAGLAGYRAIARFRESVVMGGGYFAQNPWRPMSVEGEAALSGPCLAYRDYDVQVYFTFAGGDSEPGEGGAGPVVQEDDIPAVLTAAGSISGEAGTGMAVFRGIVPDVPGSALIGLRIYAGATAVFASASPITGFVGVSRGTIYNLTATGLSPGLARFWVVTVRSDLTPFSGAELGPVALTIL